MENPKIELKNVKHMASLSHETHCFTATIYVNGKKAGTAENRGNGGNTDIYWGDKQLRDKARQYIATLPTRHYGDGEAVYSQIVDEEIYVDDLLQDWLVKKDYRRDIARRLMWIKDGAVYQSKICSKETIAAAIRDSEKVLETTGAQVLLNCLDVEKGFEQFRATFKQCAF